MLNDYSSDFLMFYLQEQNSDNWEIRECSCRCINELFKIVNDKAVFI